MVDIMSAVTGLLVGGCVGFLAAALVLAPKLEVLQGKYDRLEREHRRITDRDSRGRFVGGKK